MRKEIADSIKSFREDQCAVPGLVGEEARNKRLGVFLKKFIDDTNNKYTQMQDYLREQTESVSGISKKQLQMFDRFQQVPQLEIRINAVNADLSKYLFRNEDSTKILTQRIHDLETELAETRKDKNFLKKLNGGIWDDLLKRVQELEDFAFASSNSSSDESSIETESE